MIAGKFGGDLILEVWWSAFQLPNYKIRQHFFHAYKRMATLYRTAKFKSRQYVSSDFGLNRQI